MSKEDDRQNQIKQLWELQMQLNKYVGETETELDPSIKSALRGIQIPEWFNSGFVYSHLVLAMDHQIRTLEDEVVSSQEILKDLYFNKKERLKEIERKHEKEIVDLHKEIDTISNEIEQISKEKKVDSQEYVQNQYQSYYETEINRCKEDIAFLKKEDQELADTIQAYLEEIEISTNQIVMACEEHKRNLLLSKRYKDQINQMAFAKMVAQRSSEKLAKRTETLQSAVDKLLTMKKENEETLIDMQKDQEDFAVINSQYQKVIQSIQTSQTKQEEILNEMIKAVELTENSSASVQMYQFEIQMLESEKERLASLVKNVEDNLEYMVSNFDKKASSYYNFINDQINERMSFLKTERVKLQHEKDVIEQQIEISRQKNSTITPAFVAVDFSSSNSAEYVMKLKGDVVQIVSQKEKVLKETANIQSKIIQNNEKLLNFGHHKRKKLSKLQRKRQQIEIDVSLLRSNLKGILQKNGTVSEENEKIRCYIGQIRKSATFSLNQILNQKEENIQKLQTLINDENKEHQSHVQNYENDISKYQLMAEKYSADKQQNENDHFSKSKEKNELFQSSKQKVKYLKNIVQKNLNEMIKGQGLLKDAQDQIDFLSGEINRLIKKERSQSSLMNNAQMDQVAIATDIDRYREIEKKLDLEIENQKKISLINDINYNIDNDEEVESDPL